MEVLTEWKSLQFVTTIFSPKAKKGFFTHLVLQFLIYFPTYNRSC